MPSADYRIKFDNQAAKDVKKLHRSHPRITSKIIQLIDSLSSHPCQGKPLKGKNKGCYSLRQGDYRIIYELYSQQRIVHVIRIGHRKDIYR
ncbi:MAG: Toxin RelG [Syntrophomonadaceae bacterium]|nr:Toxin RelG [Bacillota bacterium]